MADFVATAGGNTDNAKAQALNNIAQTGQSQAAGFGQAQANDAAAKTAALKSAMAMAALRGAPSGNVAQGQATIAAPLDQRATTLDTIKGNYAANNANRAQNFGQFFDLTKAGLPIAEQRYKEQAGQLQEKAAERAAGLQAAAQARNDAHNLAMLRLSAAQEKQAAPVTPEKIIAALGGPDATADNLTGVANSNLNTESAQGAANAANGAGTGPSGQGHGIYDQLPDTPQAVGAALGLPAGTVQSLIDNATAKDATQNKGAAPPSESAIRASDQYSSGMAKFDQLMQNATSPAARTSAVAALIADVGADVARVIMGDYTARANLIAG